MEGQNIESLIEKIFSRLLSLSYSMLADEQVARDVVQDVLEKVWIKRHSFNEGVNTEAYIYRMVKNRCIDVIRRRRFQSPTEINLIAHPVHYGDNSDLKDLYSITRNIIDKLPIKQRTIITLRDIDGYDFTEISDMMSMEETAVRMALSRARKTIKEKLSGIVDYGIK